jgi:hypothetical protein
LIDADLGGGVIEQRIARPGKGKSGGFRAMILYKRATKAVFVYGFAKNGSIAVFVGKRVVEKPAPWKSPRAGLSHYAWKSRTDGGIPSFSTAPTAAMSFPLVSPQKQE